MKDSSRSQRLAAFPHVMGTRRRLHWWNSQVEFHSSCQGSHMIRSMTGRSRWGMRTSTSIVTSSALPSCTQRLRVIQSLLSTLTLSSSKILILISCSIIAITGLDGHAYGSWRGKGNLGRMWLRDFLSKDLPNCRTMIYGYNSKLSSHGINTIMDYGREFLEGIKRIRNTKEVGSKLSAIMARLT